MSERFDVTECSLQGVKVLQRRPLADSRGYFERLFCAAELHEVWGSSAIVQINRTSTVKRGTVRGMHFQHPPHQEDKIVSCLRGEVFDVAVDVRAESPTFLQWHAEILSASNHRSLFLPKGFAHGFQTLAEDSELLYCHSAAYHAASEGGLHPLDPMLGIRWPEAVTDLSVRDSSHPALTNAFRGISNEV